LTAAATLEVSSATVARRVARVARVADRLSDDWILHHTKLVAVENRMADEAFRPLRRAARSIARVLGAAPLPRDLATWDERAIVAVVTGIVAKGYNESRLFLVPELAEFGRRWMATMAGVLFRHLPDRDITRAAGHVRRRIARATIARVRNPHLSEARNPTVTLRVDASSVVADVLGQFDREAGEIARSAEGRRFVAAFDAAAAQRKRAATAAIRTAIGSGDSVDDLSQRLTKMIGGRSPEAEIDRLVRTRTQRVAFESEEVLLKYAGPAVKFVVYHAILDARTCLKCGPLNGRVFPVGPAGGPAAGGPPAPTAPTGPTSPDFRKAADDAAKRVVKPPARRRRT